MSWFSGVSNPGFDINILNNEVQRCYNSIGFRCFQSTERRSEYAGLLRRFREVLRGVIGACRENKLKNKPFLKGNENDTKSKNYGSFGAFGSVWNCVGR